MGTGEYISVSQQADSERADVETERLAQNAGPEVRAHELRELQEIWQDRGLSEELAWQVAEQLTAHDAVRAHARDELGIDIDNHPNPWHAALASMVRIHARGWLCMA
jgi:vacuolar iron transporter family protein